MADMVKTASKGADALAPTTKHRGATADDCVEEGDSELLGMSVRHAVHDNSQY